jgi:hypothetical protein
MAVSYRKPFALLLATAGIFGAVGLSWALWRLESPIRIERDSNPPFKIDPSPTKSAGPRCIFHLFGAMKSAFVMTVAS